MTQRSLPPLALTNLIITGIAIIILAIIPFSYGRSGLGYPAVVALILIPVVLAGVLAGLGDIPRVGEVLDGLSPKGLARIFLTIALMGQLTMIFGNRSLSIGGGLEAGYWLTWPIILAMVALQFFGDRIPFLARAEAGVAPTWVAVTAGTVDLIGDPVPSDQWLRLVKRTPTEIEVITQAGLTFRLAPDTALRANEEGAQS